MKNYPLEKYKFYQHILPDGTIETIAASTYCGKIVKGRSKCHPQDTYDENIAKTLAAMRCNTKIAEKRFKRSKEACKQAIKVFDMAVKRKNEMAEYYTDSSSNYFNAKNELANYLNIIKNK